MVKFVFSINGVAVGHTLTIHPVYLQGSLGVHGLTCFLLQTLSQMFILFCYVKLDTKRIRLILNAFLRVFMWTINAYRVLLLRFPRMRLEYC